MKLLIEEYQYNAKDVVDVLDGLFTLQDVDNKISVNYVGYYYNPSDKVRDCVFVLPKVLIDEHGLVFGKYDPASLIHLDRNEQEEDEDKRLKPHERKFLYEFAVWIHRAIVVYNTANENNGIVLRREIEADGNGKKKKSNTLLDVILNLIRFNKENRSFFTFILKNIHSGYNKINWNKTISETTAVVQGEEPIYLHPVNKKRQINFDEELIVIFFSILNYVAERFGFRTEIPFGFKLITGNQFERYINGFGTRRLRQIKYKYYSDIAVRLWDLCYAFFDKTYQIKMSTSQSEYLLVKSFHIVFEAIIDELIGDKDVPKGLQEQEDGKLVDHFYTYKGLISNREEENDVYYIGDSKYYKIGSDPKGEAVYKQYTYARNVIQWNLNLFLDEKSKDSEKDRYKNIRLRDDITEGYNVIPNFFVSANINPATLSYEDKTEEHKKQPPISRHFNNRLYDRDTLILSHYDVNFLYVLSLYARNNAGAKEAYRSSVREKFRKSIQDILNKSFKFYAMEAHADVDSVKYLKEHFKDVVGKVFSPYQNDNIYSLALDMSYPESQELIDKLKEDFYVAECRLGEEPSSVIQRVREQFDGAVRKVVYDCCFLTCLVRKNEEGEDENEMITKLYDLFSTHQAEGKTYVMLNMPSGDISEIKYLLPIVGNAIDGYYDIEDVRFGQRTKKFVQDGVEIPVPMSTLKIKIGKYHPFDRTYTQGIVPRMSNQIWTPQYLKEHIFDKATAYSADEDVLLAQEPETVYGHVEQDDWDYIENNQSF